MVITLLVMFYHMLNKIDAYLNCILVLSLADNQKKGNGFLMFLFSLSSSMVSFGSRKSAEHWLGRVSRLVLYLIFIFQGARY